MRPLLALALLLAGGTVLAADGALLPENGSVGGWARDGRPRVFTGSDLYGHIDGGAEMVFEFGFEELTVQRYLRGADALEVELYRMRDATGALGIYLFRCGRETPDPALAARHTAGLDQLLLVRDRYLLVVNNLTGKPELAPALVTFAGEIAAHLSADVALPALDLLPRNGRIPGSERLIRGPLALQSLITLGEGDVLRLGDGTTAAAASYADTAEQPAHKVIVAEYPSDARAGEALAYLTAHLDPEIKPLRSGEGLLVFRDYAGKYGVARVTGPRLTVTIDLANEPHFP